MTTEVACILRWMLIIPFLIPPGAGCGAAGAREGGAEEGHGDAEGGAQAGTLTPGPVPPHTLWLRTADSQSPTSHLSPLPNCRSGVRSGTRPEGWSVLGRRAGLRLMQEIPHPPDNPPQPFRVNKAQRKPLWLLHSTGFWRDGAQGKTGGLGRRPSV